MNKCYSHIRRLCHISVSGLLHPKNSDAMINLNQQTSFLNISVLIPVENQRSVTVAVLSTEFFGTGSLDMFLKQTSYDAFLECQTGIFIGVTMPRDAM